MIDRPPEPMEHRDRDVEPASASEPIDPLVERALRRSSAARRAPTPADEPTRSRARRRRSNSAPAGRLVAAGAALGGTFLLVGAMAAATAPEQPTPTEPATIRRVVVAPDPTVPPADPIVIRVELQAAATATTTSTTTRPTTTVAPTSAPVVTSPPPPPPPAPAPAPVVTESEGS